MRADSHPYGHNPSELRGSSCRKIKPMIAFGVQSFRGYSGKSIQHGAQIIMMMMVMRIGDYFKMPYTKNAII